MLLRAILFNFVMVLRICLAFFQLCWRLLSVQQNAAEYYTERQHLPHPINTNLKKKNKITK